MHWSKCRGCKEKIRHEWEATQMRLRKRKRDIEFSVHNGLYNFDFCEDCFIKFDKTFPNIRKDFEEKVSKLIKQIEAIRADYGCNKS